MKLEKITESSNDIFSQSVFAELLADSEITLKQLEKQLVIEKIPKTFAKRVVNEPYTHGVIYNYLYKSEKIVHIEELAIFLADQINNVKVDFIFKFAETMYVTRSSPYYSKAQRENAIRFKLAYYLYPTKNINDAIREVNANGGITGVELARNRKGKRI